MFLKTASMVPRCILVVLALAFMSCRTLGKDAETAMCRGTVGKLPFPTFKVWSCAMCYTYLFQNSDVLVLDRSHMNLVATENSKKFITGETFSPDIDNKTEFGQVCSSVSDSDCRRLTKCCQAAIDCCHHQNSLPLKDPSDDFCPRTWDGYSCFEDAPSGSLALKPCPSYITSSNNFASKNCTEDGNWYQHEGSRQEWTDYRACFYTTAKDGAQAQLKTTSSVITICYVAAMGLLWIF